MAWFGIEDTIAIMLWSLVFSVAAFEAARRLGNRKRQKEIREEVNRFQKEYARAAKEKDEPALKRLKLREKQVTGLMTEMMILPMKSMIIIIPLFFVFITLVQQNFSSFTITLPLGLHVNEILSLRIFSPSTYGPRGFFILASVFWGIIIEIIYSKKFEKSEPAPAAPKASPGSQGVGPSA